MNETSVEAITPREGSMAEHQRLDDELEAMSDDELRAKAEAQGIDGAHTMTREHLLAKLIDDPGANEI